jgi:hypothetical protein
MWRFALIRTSNASTGLNHVALPTKDREISAFFIGILSGN